MGYTERPVPNSAHDPLNIVDLLRTPFVSVGSLLAVLLTLVTLPLQAQTNSATPIVTTLVNFDGPDGRAPYYIGLIQATDGNFYGTTAGGGNSDKGTVFKITPAGVLTTLYSFCSQTNCIDGWSPYGGLVQGTDGNLYGTTSEGGANDQCTPSLGCGTVFRITTSGTLTTIYNFCSLASCADGYEPQDALTQGSDGNFYGTTAYGGEESNSSCTDINIPTYGCGTVFTITPDGNLTTLHTFDFNDGANPSAGVIQAADGSFYGTTPSGGSGSPYGLCSSCGTVFKMTLAGELTTLYSFCSEAGCADGGTPAAGLLQATDGDFYGVTWDGGLNTGCGSYNLGCGTLFKITSSGALTSLYDFCPPGNCTDGAGPTGTLVQGADGNLYGTTQSGGDYGNQNCLSWFRGCGTVFELTTSGTLTTLHAFEATDGDYPEGGLVQAPDGSFYGATTGGGQDNDGTVFRLALNPIPPIVTFTGAPATAPEYSAFSVIATTNSGAMPTITAAGPCNISNDTVTMIAPSGTCVLTSMWPAQGTYLAATLTQSTTAEPPAPLITWAPPAPITYGTALAGTQLDAAASYNGIKVPGTFTYTPAKGTILGAGAQILSVLFTPNNVSSFSSVRASVTLQVNPAVPKLIWNKPGVLSYGTPLSSTQLDASASVPGAFLYSPAAGAILTAGVQVLSVSFTPTDTADYQSINGTVNITVSKATPTVTVAATPSSINTLQPLSVSATVGAVSQGAIPTGSVLLTGRGYSSAAVTLSGGAAMIAIPAGSLKPGVDTIKVTYSPDVNSTSYNSASGLTSATVTVAPVTATPTFLPSSGTYSIVQTVSLLDTTPNAVIWYTTDGSIPVPGQGTAAQFTGVPINVSVTTTIKAVATATGSATSKVASATYTLKATAPTFSVPAGTYSVGQTVNVSDTTQNAAIWYTIDGSTPVPGQGTAVQFAAVPIAVNVNTTIKAVAALSGWTTSNVASATYKFAKGTIPANGLIGFWSGNNTADDSSPTANNGSFAGSYVPGRPGGGAAFNLATGIVTIPNNAAYDNFVNDPGWTVGFWFNTNGIAPNGNNDFFLGQDNGSGYQPKWFIDYGYTVFGTNQDFVWHVNDYNTERIFLTSNAVNPIPSGWNQLTVVVDNTGRSVTFYLNGQQIGSESLPTYVLETTAPLLFGEAEGATFTGLMNEVAIYNRALSAQDVLNLLDATR